MALVRDIGAKIAPCLQLSSVLPCAKNRSKHPQFSWRFNDRHIQYETGKREATRRYPIFARPHSRTTLNPLSVYSPLERVERVVEGEGGGSSILFTQSYIIPVNVRHSVYNYYSTSCTRLHMFAVDLGLRMRACVNGHPYTHVYIRVVL